MCNRKEDRHGIYSQEGEQAGKDGTTTFSMESACDSQCLTHSLVYCVMISSVPLNSVSAVH